MTTLGGRLNSISAVVVGGLIAGAGIIFSDAMYVAMGWPLAVLGAVAYRADRLADQIAELRDQIAELRSTPGDG